MTCTSSITLSLIVSPYWTFSWSSCLGNSINVFSTQSHVSQRHSSLLLVIRPGLWTHQLRIASCHWFSTVSCHHFVTNHFLCGSGCPLKMYQSNKSIHTWTFTMHRITMSLFVKMKTTTQVCQFTGTVLQWTCWNVNWDSPTLQSF